MAADLQAPIGSVTKSFTTLLALQLVGEGRVALEDTIDGWFPDLPDAASITLAMLMNHSSGFADISQVQLDVRCRDPRRDLSPDELIAMGVALPRADFTPGVGYQYSSVNTIILGRILEEITGQSYGALLQARLLTPLGLERTRLNSDGMLEAPYAHGYTDFCPSLPPLNHTSDWPVAAFSAGTQASTLDDLHAWGVALGEGFGLTIGFEKRHNRAFRIEDEAEFVRTMLADIPPAPSGAARTRATNAGREPIAA